MTHYNSMNVLSMHALIAAYSKEGMEWVDELRTVLDTNISYAMDVYQARISGCFRVQTAETYMLFLDCTGLVRGASPDH